MTNKFARTWTVLAAERFAGPHRVIHRFTKQPIGTVYPNSRYQTSWDARTPDGIVVAEGRTQYEACRRLAEQHRIRNPHTTQGDDAA